MTEIQKLKALAQKQVNPANWFQSGEIVEGVEPEDLEYIAAANPAAMLELIAEIERLQRFETAYKEFSDKTDWVVPDPSGQEIGMHVADILRKRCDDLTSHNQAQADEIVRLREELKPLEDELQKTELRALKFIHRFNAATDLGRELRLALEAIEALEDSARASKIAYDALEPFRAHAAAKAEKTAQGQQP
jgi:predicted RNase H-like nuclease (RuvC/YqgF family)